MRARAVGALRRLARRRCRIVVPLIPPSLTVTRNSLPHVAFQWYFVAALSWRTELTAWSCRVRSVRSGRVAEPYSART